MRRFPIKAAVGVNMSGFVSLKIPVWLILPKSVKRYSARTDQLSVTAYWRPPPTVHPTRVVERFPEPNTGVAENVGAEDRDIGVEAAEGNAAGRVDQERGSQATPSRPLIEPWISSVECASTVLTPPKIGTVATAVLLRLEPSTEPSRPMTTPDDENQFHPGI